MSRSAFVSALIVLLSLSHVFGQIAQPPLTNQDVISLMRSGLGEGAIAHVIKGGPAVFDLSPGGVNVLRANGVADKVIFEMLLATQRAGTSIVPPVTRKPVISPQAMPRTACPPGADGVIGSDCWTARSGAPVSAPSTRSIDSDACPPGADTVIGSDCWRARNNSSVGPPSTRSIEHDACPFGEDTVIGSDCWVRRTKTP